MFPRIPFRLLNDNGLIASRDFDGDAHLHRLSLASGQNTHNGAKRNGLMLRLAVFPAAEQGKTLLPMGDVKLGRPVNAGHPDPPETGDIAFVRRHIHDLRGAAAIRREMTYVYRAIWKGQIDTLTAGRLVAILKAMLDALKVEAEMEVLQSGYADAWTGITLTGPKAPTDEGRNGAV